MESEVDKLDVDRLVTVPVALRKLSDAVKNNIIKKDVYNAKIKNIEDKIPDITNLATNTTLNAKWNEVKKEIPGITYFRTTTALSAVGNKTPNVSNSVKKKRKKKEEANKQTIYKHTNISDIENKIATIMINLLLLKNLISQH